MALALVFAPSNVSVGAPFSPSSIAGLTHWYNADDIAGENDGDIVSSWSDSTGSLTASGGTSAVYKTGANGINSKPVVRFDGTNAAPLVTAASLTQAQPLTLTAVVRPTASTVSGTQFIICGETFTGIEFLDGTPDTIGMYAGTHRAGPTMDANPHIIVAIFNDASSELWVDGTQTTLAGSPGVGAYSAEPFYLGGKTVFLAGDLAQAQIINGVISTSDRNGLEATWGTTYGITVV